MPVCTPVECNCPKLSLGTDEETAEYCDNCGCHELYHLTKPEEN